jgi:hypothetical protein
MPCGFQCCKTAVQSLSPRGSFVPGSFEAISEFNGSVPVGNPPAKFTIPASNWDVAMRIFHPASPVVPAYYVDYNVFSGSGRTGGWNGSDISGATILPNGNSAGGYLRHGAQIMLDLEFAGFFRFSTGINYEYRGQLYWKKTKYTSGSNGNIYGSVETVPIDWASPQLTRIVKG